jgi:hypothetical protein
VQWLADRLKKSAGLANHDPKLVSIGHVLAYMKKNSPETANSGLL